MKVYWIEVMKYIEGHIYKKPSEENKMLSRKLGLGDWWEVLRKVWAAVWFSSWRHQPRKLPPACCQLLLLAACTGCACLKLDFLFLLFLPPFILFFLIILFISVPPAPPDLLPYFSPPPRP